MVTVDYQYTFNYRQFGSRSFPILQARISHLDNPELAFDTDVYLDSGAEGSVLNGNLLAALGIELINNKPRRYSSTLGNSITAYLHEVRLTIPDVADFHLEIGFSNGEIRRNLLGRDFFDLVQIGFREHQLQYYLEPTP